jgi:PPOX class probable F420-dependent enzyme
MDLERALAFAAEHKNGVIITLRRDGRPQSSNIVYVMDGPLARVSITDDRAKTRNLRRDPRAVLHVSADNFWSYVALDGLVELSPVAKTPGDDACRELAEVYERAAGKPHPNWDEYFEAMINDKRLVMRFRATSAAGMLR